ncbi:MAG: DUF2293 domain-containing protein [Solirubrobacteraceae bacterium]
MTTTSSNRLEERVARAAQAALDAHGFVTAIDVLLSLGWVEPRRVDEWRQGRIECLEEALQVGPDKIPVALRLFDSWAQHQGLSPSETAYVARTRARPTLRFSKGGDGEVERAYRTHWVSPQLSERQRARMAERQSRPPDLVVISPVKEWTCTACDGSGDLLIMDGPGPLCMTCADLDHLVYLPAGSPALTRRAKAGSSLSAIVVRFSRSRGRYERQGILVEEDALGRAERECLADAEARSRRREREHERRGHDDLRLQARLADAIATAFPGCPAARAQAIARHAATRGSGRVGRTAAARKLDRDAVELAVVASVRHGDTAYDELLMSGIDRAQARDRVRDDVRRVLDAWRQP